MALDQNIFRTRSVSAAVFVVIMLAGMLSHWTFFLLFSIIHFGCWVEYQRILGLIDRDYHNINSFHRYGVMIAGWGLMLYQTSDDFQIGDLMFHSLGFWLGLLFLFLLPVTELLFSNTISLKNILYSLSGIVYISLSLALLISLMTLPPVYFNASVRIPLLVLACMWINDTMAYIVGSVFGKTPFSSISPKKTWEGTIGGVILTIIVISTASRVIPVLKDFSIIHFIIIPLIAAIAGVLGDLLESKLKRMAGIKDSGSILPGHGGFLDRFDSLLIAGPCVWLYIELVLKP